MTETAAAREISPTEPFELDPIRRSSGTPGNAQQGTPMCPRGKNPVTLRLPWPPSVNTYWRHVVMGRSARTLLSAQGRDYRLAAGGEILVQGATCANFTGRLAVHITAYPPDRRARDIDNLPKGVLDAMTAARVWRDDSQVDDLRITRGPVVRGGRIIVRIETIDP